MTVQDSAVISVCRADRWMGKLRQVDVLIDGDVAGKLRNGESRDFSVSGGEHSVVVQCPWLTSNSITVAVADGDIVKLDYEDNSKVNYWAMGACGGLVGILAPFFDWLGLPTILPWFAAAVCSFGGYTLLEKLGLLGPMTRIESQLKLQIAE